MSSISAHCQGCNPSSIARADLAKRLPNFVELVIASDQCRRDLSNIRRLVENAGNQLKRVTLEYGIHLAVIKCRDEAEIDCLVMAAQQRGIDLRMKFVLSASFGLNPDNDLAKVCRVFLNK